MATSRRFANDLHRALDAATVPICLFDDSRTVQFANAACGDWIGLPPSDLVGQRASYHSSPESSPDAAVNRICPPPEAFAGNRTRGLVYAADDNSMRRRWADFLPLATDDGFVVLAILSATDAGDDDAIANTDDPQQLRDRVACFRAEHATRFRLDRLIGDSPAIECVRQQVQAAIASRANTLITGPAGSGREYVARTIFYGSRQEGEQIVKVDCRLATDESLTSLVASLAARPRGSPATVLLLHLDSFPDTLRSELLRQTKTRVRDVRFLATSQTRPDGGANQPPTEANLDTLIATITIRLPMLVERRPDIPLLAQLLLEEINASGEKQVRGFSASAIDELVGYNWPRNMEELVEFVAAAHASSETAEVSPDDFPRRLRFAADASRRPRRQPESIVLDDFLAQIERELIQRAVNVAKGNKARAARLLGLTRPRLYRRMVQLGLESTEPANARTAPEPSRQTGPAGDIPEFIDDLPFEEEPDE
jgi:transcriptional regulator with PAS, ATPase and Fis domain